MALIEGSGFTEENLGIPKEEVSHALIKYGIDKTPVKKKILQVLYDKNNLSILEICNILKEKGDKYNYRTIWQHIQSLYKEGWIELNKEEHKPGKPVIISLPEDMIVFIRKVNLLA